MMFRRGRGWPCLMLRLPQRSIMTADQSVWALDDPVFRYLRALTHRWLLKGHLDRYGGLSAFINIFNGWEQFWRLTFLCSCSCSYSLAEATLFISCLLLGCGVESLAEQVLVESAWPCAMLRRRLKGGWRGRQSRTSTLSLILIYRLLIPDAAI